MENGLVKASANACGTPEVAEQIGPQTCFADIVDAFRDYAIDPMNYQSKVQFFKINNGVMTSKNKYVKFAVNNTLVGHADQIIRIGAASLTGEYELYNIAAGASDSAAISDDYGTNVKKIQGYSTLVRSKPMIITQFRMVSSDANQLAVSVNYNTINPDMSITPQEIDLVATQNKSDQRDTLIVAYGTWILDPAHYIEYTAVDNVRHTLLLEVGAIKSVDNYVQM